MTFDSHLPTTTRASGVPRRFCPPCGLVSAPQAHPFYHQETQEAIFWVPAGGFTLPRKDARYHGLHLGSLPRTGRSIRIAQKGNLHAKYHTLDYEKFYMKYYFLYLLTYLVLFAPEGA